jgi:hypothetical protein
MSIRIKVYTKILDVLNVIYGYVNTALCGYHLQKNREYADEFLAGFRSRSNYARPGTEGKRKPKTDCKHLKGGNLRLHGAWTLDYNVLTHTFSDGSVTIRCGNGCGFVSRPGDENWSYALNMAQESSNKSSSSERIFDNELIRKATIAVYLDKI